MNALTVTREDELTFLRRRVRELQEEVAERERRGAILDAPDIDREHAVWCVFGRPRSRRAWVRCMLALLDRPGRVMSKEALLPYCVRLCDNPQPKLVDVIVCHMRAALASRGITDAVHSVWGRGHVMTPAGAAAIKALLGEAGA